MMIKIEVTTMIKTARKLKTLIHLVHLIHLIHLIQHITQFFAITF